MRTYNAAATWLDDTGTDSRMTIAQPRSVLQPGTGQSPGAVNSNDKGESVPAEKDDLRIHELFIGHIFGLNLQGPRGAKQVFAGSWIVNASALVLLPLG